MRLLLDEMMSGAVAGILRDRGHDVVAVQDPDLAHLRGIDDCDVGRVLAALDLEQRARPDDDDSSWIGWLRGA